MLPLLPRRRPLAEVLPDLRCDHRAPGNSSTHSPRPRRRRNHAPESSQTIQVTDKRSSEMFALLIPTLLSFVVLAAHFFRNGHTTFVLICCAAPMLLLVRRTWATRLL